MLQLLSALRHKVAIGFVGGSDLAKQQEQLGTPSIPVTNLFDFCFAENGLTAIRMGVPLASHSFIKWIGEDNYKQLVRFILHYVADLDIPVKRGTFVEFRNGMINVSPIGRNATVQERNEYEKFDLEHKIREKFVLAIKEKFPDLGLTYVSWKSPKKEENEGICFANNLATATRSAAKSPSTSSRPAGTRLTACSMLRLRSRSRASSTARSTSLATRRTRAATIMRSSRTRARWGTA
jgi:HAD superfamily hydrolase (TIGR01484 family)